MSPVNRRLIRRDFCCMRKLNFCMGLMILAFLPLMCCMPVAAYGQEPVEDWNQSGIGAEQSLSDTQEGLQKTEKGQAMPVSQDEQKPGDQGMQEGQDMPELDISIMIQDGKNAQISWQNAGAVLYEVQRSSQKNGIYKTIASLEQDDCKYIDKTVKSGTQYYYCIRALLDNDEYIYSKPAAFICPLDKVTDVKLTRYSSASIKISWKKSSGAQYYKIYCSKKKGKYEYAGITKKDRFLVKNLDVGQKYYFYVQSCAEKKESKWDSEMSKVVSMRTRAYDRTTIFAGDSVTAGLSAYHALDTMAIGGIKHVVADIGLNTTTFRTRRVFNGKSGLDQVISSKPYRVYLMLGINEIHYRNVKDVAAGYQDIVQAIQAGTPDTDIVLLSVSPVTKAEQQRRNGFTQIPDLNKRIKAIAVSCGVKYYDYTDFLKDTDGCLKEDLASSDGVHWTASAYYTFAEIMESYDLSLDE